METLGGPFVLDEIAREGGRKMLSEAIEAEVAGFGLGNLSDGNGKLCDNYVHAVCAGSCDSRLDASIDLIH